jgi:hypothetical protein
LETAQLHDFDPGFAPPAGTSGRRLFWTLAIPDADVQVQFGAGRAEMHVNNLAMDDYFNLPNALAEGPEVDATVSFDVVWSGPIARRVHVGDGTLGNNYAGDYVENQVTVTWSGSNELGFRFTANPGTLATSSFDGGFAELGHEHNGDFGGASVAAPRANPARDLAFASLTLQGANGMTPPVSTPSSLAPPSQLKPAGSGEEQPLPAGQLTNGSPGDTTAKVVTATPTVQEHAFRFVADAAATSTIPFAEVGQQGEDPLFR